MGTREFTGGKSADFAGKPDFPFEESLKKAPWEALGKNHLGN